MKFMPNRRVTLATLSAGALVSCTEAVLPTLKDIAENPVFAHGVASGDPDSTSLVIWTRVTSTRDRETVSWELSKTADFKQLSASGTQGTSAARDYTVKVVVEGLEAGQSYYYRFKTETMTSPLGCTKTLPIGAVESLGVALVSCSNYPFGYFNAYDAIAKDKAVDIVLHTGDYIYEYASDGWGAETGQVLGRPHDPTHEIVSLSDYRTRHAQYKSDTGAQAMHAAHPFICLWDDHESANNPWVGGAQNHNPEDGEGEWTTRRAASVEAYYEWMPIRDPKEGDDPNDFWRTYVFGDLATLVTLETRHTARAKQINYEEYSQNILTTKDAKAFIADVIGAPDRKMISTPMENTLTAALKASVQSGQPWRLIGNASPIARMPVPDVEALGVLLDADPVQMEKEASKSLRWKGKYNMPFYTDTWDGYAWAREKLYEVCGAVGATDLVFLTGDSHSFWMNKLADDSGQPMGLELGTAGISSPGDFVGSGWDDTTAERLDRVFESELDEVVWTDNFHQGYVRVELFPTKAKASFVAVSTVLTPRYTTKIIKQTGIEHRAESVDYVDL